MTQPSPSLRPFMLVTSTQMHRQGEIPSESDIDIQDAAKHVMKALVSMPLYMGISLVHMLYAASMALCATSLESFVK